MQITFTFDTTNKSDLDLLNKITDFAAKAQDAQPEVAGNTGSTATGVSSLSPEGSGVSEPVAEQAPAAPVKKSRAKKEAAPVVELEAPAEEPELELAEPEAKTYTLDEVRAALQQFTAKSGVPAGIDLLKSFNAGRISELDADDYAAFVERCAA